MCCRMSDFLLLLNASKLSTVLTVLLVMMHVKSPMSKTVVLFANMPVNDKSCTDCLIRALAVVQPDGSDQREFSAGDGDCRGILSP